MRLLLAEVSAQQPLSAMQNASNLAEAEFGTADSDDEKEVEERHERKESKLTTSPICVIQLLEMEKEMSYRTM